MADQPGTPVNDGEAAFRVRLEVLENSIFPRTQLPDRADQTSSAKAFLEALPVVQIEDSADECHICKEPFSVTLETATRLPCDHVFGADCLKTWLESSNSCPLCRVTLFVPSQQDSRILLRAISFGQSEEEGQRMHAAISEWVTLLRQERDREQSSYREQSEAFERLMRERNDNDLDLAEVSVLEIEMGELAARLDELNTAPDTEENRATMSRIDRRNTEIAAALAAVEDRIRERML